MKFKEAKKEVKEYLTKQVRIEITLYSKTIELLGFKTQLLTTLDLEQTYWRTFYNLMGISNVIELLNKLNKENIQTAIITDLTSQFNLEDNLFGLENILIMW